MKWFLLIYLLSDDTLVKEYNTKKQCEKTKQTLQKIFKKETITCEKGEIFQTMENREQNESD